MRYLGMALSLIGAVALCSTPVMADQCTLCLMQVGQKIHISAEESGVMIYCTTFQKAVDWELNLGGDGSMCHNRKSGGITAYTLDGGGDVFVSGKWTGPF